MERNRRAASLGRLVSRCASHLLVRHRCAPGAIVDARNACGERYRTRPDSSGPRILGTSHAPPVWEESLLQSSANLIVAMSPDDRFVSADGMLHSVHVWDAHSHALLATIDLSMLIGNPSLLEFSPDSRYLAYATYDGAVAVVDWRAESVVLHDIPKGQNWSPQQVWFAQDGSSVHFLDSRGKLPATFVE